MAASTAGMVSLMGPGGTRNETFTMTPANDEYATFANSGLTHVKIAPGGESIVDIQFNNDGVTTCSQFLFKSGGQDIRNRLLMVLFAGDSKIANRLVAPIKFAGGSELQIQFKT